MIDIGNKVSKIATNDHNKTSGEKRMFNKSINIIFHEIQYPLVKRLTSITPKMRKRKTRSLKYLPVFSTISGNRRKLIRAKRGIDKKVPVRVGTIR